MTGRILVPALVAMWLTQPALAEACFCGADCASVLTAPVLFEATIVGLEPDPASGSPAKIVRLGDVRAWRGPAPLVLEMEGSSCDTDFKLGARYLIDAQQWAPGKFGASACGLTRPADRVSGLIAFLSAPTPAERPRVWGTVTSPIVDHRTFVSLGGGPAVAGAVVTLSGPVSRSTTTSSRGEFLFGAVPDGTYRITIDVAAGRRDVEAPPPRDVVLGGRRVCASVDLHAAPTSRVVGWVRDAQGRPLADVQVEMYTPPDNPFRRDYERVPAGTDAAGRFEFTHVTPGRWVVGVGVPRPDENHPFAPAFARTADGSRVFVVAPGATLELPAIVARGVTPVAVEGRVTGPDGAPLGALRVVASPVDTEEESGWRIAETTADGRFQAELYRGVRYRVYAVGAGWRSATVDVVPGNTGAIALALAPSRR